MDSSKYADQEYSEAQLAEFIVEGVKKADKVLSSLNLECINLNVENDNDIREFWYKNKDTTYHYCGTCPQTNDETSVVDQNYRVFGTKNLFVCDASTLSYWPASTSYPVCCIAYEAAQMIKDYQKKII